MRAEVGRNQLSPILAGIWPGFFEQAESENWVVVPEFRLGAKLLSPAGRIFRYGDDGEHGGLQLSPERLVQHGQGEIVHFGIYLCLVRLDCISRREH